MSNLLIRVFSLVTYALRLRAFRLLISSSDGSVKRELAVKHNTEKIVNKFLVDNIKAATLYTAIIKTVCVFENLRKGFGKVFLTLTLTLTLHHYELGS